MNRSTYDNQTPFWAIIDMSRGVDVIELSEWDVTEWQHFKTLKQKLHLVDGETRYNNQSSEIKSFPSEQDAVLFAKKNIPLNSWCEELIETLKRVDKLENPPSGYFWSN